MQIALTVLVSLFLAFPAGAAHMLDRVVAIVNDDVITQRELDRTLADIAGTPGGLLPRRQILERLIDERLLDQAIADAKITLSDEELETAFQRFLHENHVSREQFAAALAQRGRTVTEFQVEMTQQLRQMKFLQSAVGKDIRYSERDLLNHYTRTTQVGLPALNPAVHIAEIVLPWPDTGSVSARQRTRTKAKKIAAAARYGNFAAVARRHSRGANAAQGGERAASTLDRLDAKLAAAVRRLQVGQVSDPVDTTDGIFIVKLLEPFTTVAAREDFERQRPLLEQALYKSRMTGALEQYLGRLRAKAYIEVRE